MTLVVGILGAYWLGIATGLLWAWLGARLERRRRRGDISEAMREARGPAHYWIER